MNLFLLGASHHSAPVDVRERIDFTRRGVPEALAEIAQVPGLSEVVILSTCNRSEIYAACEEPRRIRERLTAFMSAFHDVPESQLVPHVYTRADADVVRHLFRVAAGLDSLVVGEPQILGQVKDAYTVASEQRYTGVFLNRLFHWSFGTGKRVRSDTGIGEGAVSVSYAAISLARKIFGTLDNLRALLVGAGEMAELTASHLRSQRVRRIGVANRTAAHASALAAKVDGEAVPWDRITDELTSSDIVVTATGSASPIITRADVETAMKPRRDRPLFIIDIGVPRDVDPASAEIEQVFLYNIDDLRSIIQENLSRRQSQVDLAERMVTTEVDRYMAWLRSRAAIPTVVALRERFEAIRVAELERLEPKLAALPPDARARIDEVTRLLVERLLSAPTEQLKAATDEEAVAAYAEALNRLFRLSDRPRKANTAARDQAIDPIATTSRGRGR
ncbi:MAG: glutamyl-tRNA reductase [Vicinamibacterales bacterium]